MHGYEERIDRGLVILRRTICVRAFVIQRRARHMTNGANLDVQLSLHRTYVLTRYPSLDALTVSTVCAIWDTRFRSVN